MIDANGEGGHLRGSAPLPGELIRDSGEEEEQESAIDRRGCRPPVDSWSFYSDP